jgi:cytoskeletal protein RodZ
MNTNRKDEDIILSHEFLEEMKRIREQRGISIEEVAEKTNIKSSYIRAIEEGDLSRLPGGIYNRAFIRSISEFLGINTKPYERKVESDEMIKERQVRVEIGRPLNASMPSKVTIIGCLFVIFVLYSIFYGPRVSKKEQVENAIETYHEQQIEKAEEKMEATQNPQEQVAIQSELQAKITDETGSDFIRSRKILQ